ncbi:hypothetical protein DK926_18740 [Rhodococcus sp. Eu-32]|uniref:hypothetical protein n=1 Tax=Rhodococcus sp. Eu-32 TaxID=1017319 RepID=UPI000DF400EB|nr:hypothetical protein [Rhodococcus sp. Eu-32]RRQ26286.1 hypothetical protein DK926_18740 [Rhodococcus sp. Eu-32]
MSDTLFEPEWESVRAEDLVISLHRGRVMVVRGERTTFTGTFVGTDELGLYIDIYGRSTDGRSSKYIKFRPGDTVQVMTKGSGS